GKRAGDLPLHLTVSPTDKIGRLYNVIRKELDDFFSDVRPLADFRGLIVNGRFDREMYKEAGQIATVYGVNISLILKKREKYQQEVTDAQAELYACDMNDAVARAEGIQASQHSQGSVALV